MKNLKETVRQKYADIAISANKEECCTEIAESSCCSEANSTWTMAGDYSEMDGYEADADLSLGCGVPTEIANIQKGDIVVDLGAGAGNDVFVTRQIVGAEGKVIGIDMTQEMIDLALKNKQKLGYENVDFILNEIENMKDITNSTADVVISNCVMNLVPNKEKAFAEVNRILKEGGHFSISDIVHTGKLPQDILDAADMYAGCVSGSSEKGKYLDIIKAAGFKNIQIKKEKKIELPDDLLLQYLSADQLEEYNNSSAGIYSVTVYADKLTDEACCESTETSCC